MCEKRKEKIDNPIPARVEKELDRLAFWDLRAAEIQRAKMLAYYRKKQLSR